MSDNQLTIHDRLEDILESINLIQEWSEGRTNVDDFMSSSTGVMAFNACVMRFQVIGEHVGKLLKNEANPLAASPQIPWQPLPKSPGRPSMDSVTSFLTSMLTSTKTLSSL